MTDGTVLSLQCMEQALQISRAPADRARYGTQSFKTAIRAMKS
jgi:hypothetical protein